MRKPEPTPRTSLENASSDLPQTAQESTEMPTVDTGKPKARRGFAAMNPERRREIARKGGASVPSEKRSFAKDRDLAANAGRKGGEASRGGGRTRTPGAKETWEA
jgi:general stress protein YciG